MSDGKRATSLDKSEQAKEKERKQIEAYKALEEDFTDRIKAKDYSNATLQLTSQLLGQNPEYYTIWNYRRVLLQAVFARELHSGNDTVAETDAKDSSDAEAAKKAGLTLAQQEISLLIKEDLQFLIPLLKQFPKCYWIWNHRSWLLTTATTHLPAGTAVQFWQGELALIGKMLALDSRNFHGWGYRRTVVNEVERLGGSSMAEQEFEYTTKMINTNLSNFSAWHYRSQLIPRLLSERQAGNDERRKFLDAEFELITQALYTDPYDQSLWFYHQYLMSTLDPSNAQSAPILDPCTNADRLHYLEQELDSVKDMLDGAEDCKYIYQALLDYSRRYIDIEAGNKKVTTMEMKQWLDELRKLDPLREGRWSDLEVKLGL
ncbi:Rab geranylgeranyltransferase [Vermiconidia calcicola]|uniref:Rab geranylgeranyltransferase n=1 Tax=Vermiconidia calcicola TaxID=1690605 RepID=A0ACC3ML65_9PEZI|nr:Rab geranylgeranyltransferase [Vermiconidia calcicola]